MQAVTDNPAKSRYELHVDGEIAVADYEAKGNVRVVTHVGVPSSLGGRGIGSRLAEGLLEDIRARGLKVEPVCSFMVGYFNKHPEHADLLAK